MSTEIQIDMSTWVSFAAAYGLVLLTPGPNLVLVLDAAFSGSLRVGFAAALGVATGAAGLAALSVVISTIIAPVETIGVTGEVAFGALVLALGVRTLSSAARAPRPARAFSPRRLSHFHIAFVTAFTNPVSGVFFLVAVGGFGPVSAAEQATLCALVFASAALLFGSVAAVGSVALRRLESTTGIGARVRNVCRIAAGVGLVALGGHRLVGAAIAAS